MNADDRAWTIALQNRDDDALIRLRSELQVKLRKALSGQSRVDEAFLEDALQDSILRILQRLDQFEGRSRFLTWSTSIAIRVAMSALRRKHWRDVSLNSVVTDDDLVPVQAVDPEMAPPDKLQRDALVEAMCQVLNTQLSSRQRTALLAELKGMPQDEIARHLGSNRNAIYKLTHDARRKLRQGLELAGYAAEDVFALAGQAHN